MRFGHCVLLATAGLAVLLSGCTQNTGRSSASVPSTSPASVTSPQPDGTVRVAGIVLKWITADKQRNYDRAEPLIREAAARGARIVITTECFLDGYAIRDKAIPIDDWRALGERIPGGPYLEQLEKLADDLDIHLIAGMVERDGEATYNTAVVIDPDGRLIGKYRKQDLGHEAPRNTPGCESPVFETPHGRIGLMICADRRQPEIVKRLGDQHVDLMVCPSGGMWGPVRNDYHLQDRSRENHAPIVFVHPIEFLVTAADGEILERRFAGEDMSIEPERIGSEADSHLVGICDLRLER